MVTPVPFVSKVRDTHDIVEASRKTTGLTFYVHNGTGASTNGGTSPTDAIDSVDNAVAKCTANKGDRILAMPGHAGTISAAAGLAMDVAGITLIGLGDGGDTPTLTLDTANTADIDIDAANITIENIHFIANFLDIAACLDVNADDLTLRRCRFTDTSTALNFLVCVQPGTANQSDRITIEDCSCTCKGAANTHFINMSAAQDGMIIRRNLLMGNWETMCIGGAGVVTYCSILFNIIFNEVTDGDHCINMAATSTGVCAGNLVTGGHASAGVVPGDLGSLQNFYEGNTTDLSGSLEPAVA